MGSGVVSKFHDLYGGAIHLKKIIVHMLCVVKK